ncbi:hypothetical protein ACHAWF_006674 [Thalassiosira exigua]
MQYHRGQFDPAAAAAAGSGFPAQYLQRQQQLQRQGPLDAPLSAPVHSPTHRDVLNGRGQGVQRHPGNVKYRTLVFVNKGLYAKCPRSDKTKISKGIVAAVRELGGRFLELDERTGIYSDIGDKKATDKTSQALREGQTKIRKQMHKDEETPGAQATYDTSMLDGGKEISAEGYFGYSVQVLQSLYENENNDKEQPLPPLPAPAAPEPQPLVVPSVGQAAISIPSGFASSANMEAKAAAMAMALDQFPGALPPALAPPQAQPQQMDTPQLPADVARPSLGRLTNMSLASILSIDSVRELLESARASELMPADYRYSAASVTTEIRDLIRMSEQQLVQVDSMTVDEINIQPMETLTADGAMHEDQEVLIPDEDGADGVDRVSELRFTDAAGGGGGCGGAAAVGFGDPHNPRETDSSDSTSYSKISLMDASMMTIPAEDMSVYRATGRGTVVENGNGDEDSTDLESAQLLLRLSTDPNGGK